MTWSSADPPIFDDPDDENNLNFLMGASTETLEDWYKVVSEEDIQYASVLLEAARIELIDRTEISDYTESSLIITQVKG